MPMPATHISSRPALAKVLDRHVERTHWQTAIVRTVIDEIERCEYSLELAGHLNLQLIDELRRLARRVLDVADALESTPLSEVDEPEPEPSGVRLRTAL